MTKVTDMWHKPPTITPNYGQKKKSFMPKSNVPRVLLHDNVSQQHILEARLSHIRHEHHRAQRVLELHRKSFLLKQAIRQQKHMAFARSCPLFNSKSLGNLQTELSPLNGDTSQKPNPLFLKRAHTSFIPNSNSRNSNGKDSPDAKRFLKRGDVSSERLPSIHQDFKSRAKSSVVPANHLGNNPIKTFTTYDFHLRREPTFANQSNSRPVSKTGRTVTLNDPRFLSLEDSLHRPDRPVDGFIQLSPSGHGILEKYGVPLYDYEALRRSLEEYGHSPAGSADDKSSKSDG